MCALSELQGDVQPSGSRHLKTREPRSAHQRRCLRWQQAEGSLVRDTRRWSSNSGAPDGWTDGLGLSDTARYRGIGNGVAVPVFRSVAANLARVDEQIRVLEEVAS